MGDRTFKPSEAGKSQCYQCGKSSVHKRDACPAINATCLKCKSKDTLQWFVGARKSVQLLMKQNQSPRFLKITSLVELANMKIKTISR